MNIVLDDRSREAYKDTIAELGRLCPETIKRKIARANVQQAFVLDAARRLCPKDGRILSVGAYEDTASESLRNLGHNIVEIDPVFNTDLASFVKDFPDDRFDIVISTSVMEHVQDDELFVAQICGALNDGGYAILTCDFNDDYKPGSPKPVEDHRLYTKHDLTVRLKDVLEKHRCRIWGEVNYSGKTDFVYGGCTYAFATLVFRKEN